eukprot:scaffold80450_cov35-Attheya_sp.AAC.1
MKQLVPCQFEQMSNLVHWRRFFIENLDDKSGNYSVYEGRLDLNSSDRAVTKLQGHKSLFHP